MGLFRFFVHPLGIALLIGIAVGIVAALAAERIDHVTSTDAFCGTQCHSMEAFVTTEETYLTSPHRTATSGMHAGCADCHIPAGLVPATWAHVKGGIKDIIAEVRHDFTQPGVWEQRRARLAYDVRDWLLETDSATCRSCHDEAAIQPERKRGQRQHAEAMEKGMTCIACHYNLVHAEVEPRESFLERSEQGISR